MCTILQINSQTQHGLYSVISVLPTTLPLQLLSDTHTMLLPCQQVFFPKRYDLASRDGRDGTPCMRQEFVACKTIYIKVCMFYCYGSNDHTHRISQQHIVLPQLKSTYKYLKYHFFAGTSRSSHPHQPIL